MTGPKMGERVRVRCGATGRYLKYGLALVVSSQDNERFIDTYDAAPSLPPSDVLPVPSDDAVEGACLALTYASVYPAVSHEPGEQR